MQEKALHYGHEYTFGRKYYTANHWAKTYEQLDPRHLEPGEIRDKCVKLLKEALVWHLKHENNIEQCAEIKKALQKLTRYDN